MARRNGKTILNRDTDLIIDLDTSSYSWGAACQDISTGGQRSNQEKTVHKLSGAAGSSRQPSECLQRPGRSISVSLRIDNTTAAAHINNQG